MVAVINELNQQTKGDLEVAFICDRGYWPQAFKMMRSASLPVKVHKIFAGKIRRYHKLPLNKRLLDFSSFWLNLRDLVFVGVGLVQSLVIISRFKPDVIFTKGGFVCLPVGLAGKLLGCPLVIHDSDFHAGLTNRILSRWASLILTGAPLDNYNYPKERSYYVGIPVDPTFFRRLSAEQKRRVKAGLGLPDIDRPMVLVTGGGLGAKRLNRAVAAAAGDILKLASIVHISGSGDYDEMCKLLPGHAGYCLLSFVASDMAKLEGAADVMVTRAGATALAEAAASAKPVIIVPNAMLSGGHQLKNAAVFSRAEAAVVLDETELINHPERLANSVIDLIKNAKKAARLSRNISGLARPDAAARTAEWIIQAAGLKRQEAVSERWRN